MTVASSISMNSAQPTMIGARNSNPAVSERSEVIAADYTWTLSTIDKPAGTVKRLRARGGSVAVARNRGAGLGSLGVASDRCGKQLAQARLDDGIAGGALAPAPRAQRDDCLGHVAMAAGAADIAEQGLHRLARAAAAGAVIAHRDHQVGAELAGDGDPLDALELEA